MEGDISVIWLQGIFLGNSLTRWLLAIGITIGILAIIGVTRSLIIRHFRPLAKQPRTFAYDAILMLAERTHLVVLALSAAHIGSLSLILPPSALIWSQSLSMIALLIQMTIWGNALINGWVTNYQMRNIDANAGRVGTARVLSFVVQFVFYSVVLLLALDNIPGVEVTTLVASLGIGGIAVALAVQSLLSDLFASLSIALDQPFIIGDFITLDNLAGTVEKLGLRSTRLRSLSGEQLSISNADLLNSRIHNYQRMQERRIVFSFGVLYETSATQLRAIPAMIRAIVENQEHARFDRAHFKSFDDFALTFEVVYYVLSPEYNVYMDTQQAINLAIFEQFGTEGINFAYPTQMIYTARANRQALKNGHTLDVQRDAHRT